MSTLVFVRIFNPVPNLVRNERESMLWADLTESNTVEKWIMSEKLVVPKGYILIHGVYYPLLVEPDFNAGWTLSAGHLRANTEQT